MAHITNFVPKLPICSNLCIFCPSNPLLGPKIDPYPSEYLPKHVFLFGSPSSKWGGGSAHQSENCRISQKVPKRSALAYYEYVVVLRSFLVEKSKGQRGFPIGL